MKDLFCWLAVALMTLITAPICLLMVTITTLLFPIFFVIKLFDFIFGNTSEEKASNKFEEFIFLCYGLCALCLILPFDIVIDY